MIFLHSGIFTTKKSVFNDFRERRIITSNISDSTLRSWWINDFWHVKVKMWQPFAKCDTCVSVRAGILATNSDLVKDDLRLTRAKHRSQVSLGRKRFALREAFSVRHPDQFLHVSIDAMDNKKTNVPQQRSLTYTKSSSNIGETMKTRLMGENTSNLLAFLTNVIIKNVLSHRSVFSRKGVCRVLVSPIIRPGPKSYSYLPSPFLPDGAFRRRTPSTSPFHADGQRCKGEQKCREYHAL